MCVTSVMCEGLCIDKFFISLVALQTIKVKENTCVAYDAVVFFAWFEVLNDWLVINGGLLTDFPFKVTKVTTVFGSAINGFATDRFGDRKFNDDCVGTEILIEGQSLRATLMASVI